MRMNWTPAFVVLGLLASCAAGPSGRTGASAPLQAITSLDLDRYLGLWYEIARYPNRFERGCQGVTAQYAKLPDGRVSVRNTCRLNAPDGPARVALGSARVVDPVSKAKLKVRFAPDWIPFAEGDYWVVWIDPGYQAALVGEPSGQYLWMLARSPKISRELRQAMDSAAIKAGYDLSRLEEVVQK